MKKTEELRQELYIVNLIVKLTEGIPERIIFVERMITIFQNRSQKIFYEGIEN